jgi:hypothetical protein
MILLEDLVKTEVPAFKWAAFNFRITNDNVADFSMHGLFDTLGYEISSDELNYTGDDEWVWTKDKRGKLIRGLFSYATEETDPYDFICSVLNQNKMIFLKSLQRIHNFRIFDKTNYECYGVIYIINSGPVIETDFFEKYRVDFAKYNEYPCNPKVLDQWIMQEMGPLNTADKARLIRIEAVKQKKLAKQEDGKLVLGENIKGDDFISEVEDCEGNLISFNPSPDFKGVMTRFVLIEEIANTVAVN